MPLASDLGVSDVLAVVIEIFQIEGDQHGDEYKFLCPVHAENSPSADVNLDSGLWSCFSCGAKGDLAGLGSVVLERSREEIIALLKPGTPDAKLSAVQRKLQIARQSPAISSTMRQELDLPTPGQYGTAGTSQLDYMRQRGFTKATCRAWNVRWVRSQTLTKDDGDQFTIKDSIGIPVRSRDGKLQAWCYRKTDLSAAWQPRYLYTPGFDLSGNWFGLHMVDPNETVYIVEGPMDAMWLWQHGFPALALMGSNHKNPRKFRLLLDFRNIVLVPDYDAGGVFMAHRVGLILRGRVPVSVARWPKAVVARTGKDEPDPQDIREPKDLKLVVSRAIPWQAWCLRRGLPTKGE